MRNTLGFISAVAVVLSATSGRCDEGYRMNRYSLNSGGGPTVDGTHLLNCSVGQSVAGFDSNAKSLAWIGFWAGDVPEPRHVPWIGAAKILPDSPFLSIAGKIATAGTSDFSGFYYVEEPTRSSGIRIVAPPGSLPTVARGDIVDVIGRTSINSDGEVYIQADTVTSAASSLDVEPVGMRNGMLGGEARGLQQGVVDYALPWWWQCEYSIETNNIGLLITTWGRVTGKGTGYLYVDDGSHLKDGTSTGEAENVGVRVICDPSGYSVGDILIVTGISSCFETPAGKIARHILTRKPEEMRKAYP